MTENKNLRFLFAIDRGGTFTDVYAEVYEVEEKSAEINGENTSEEKKKNHRIVTMKLLSQDPNYADAPLEAIRRIIQQEKGIKIEKDEKIDINCIDSIRMGTTVATNALLERKGERVAFVTTKGFGKLLSIGNQARPNIFDLKISKYDEVCEETIEVNERIAVITKGKSELVYNKEEINKNNYTEENIHTNETYINVNKNTDCKKEGEEDSSIQLGTTKEKIVVIKNINEEEVYKQLMDVYNKGIRTLAVAFLHSYTFPKHEQQVEKIALKIGFTHISLSSKLSSSNKFLQRASTVCADAYLTPAVNRYIQSFIHGFAIFPMTSSSPPFSSAVFSPPPSPPALNLKFMLSDGTLAPTSNFSGVKAILSGPAAGVIGVSKTAYEYSGGKAVIGFDMGGTSTDVVRYEGGGNDLVFESVAAGIFIQAPQLDIHSIAAGGGSRLFFRGGMLHVGPESAGAFPGPLCYRNPGGMLALTDANVILGRILPDRFPKIFGENCDSSIDVTKPYDELSKLRDEINKFNIQKGRAPLTTEEVALGYVEVANAAMARPILALTQGRGYEPSQHVLACFGGAGALHACAMARSLHISKIYIHKLAGILSAYGLAKATVKDEEDFAVFIRFPPVKELTQEDEKFAEVFRADLIPRIEETKKHLCGFLTKQAKCKQEGIRLSTFLFMHYEGTETTIMMDFRETESISELCQRFVEAHRKELGFELSTALTIEKVRVVATYDEGGGETKTMAPLKPSGNKHSQLSEVDIQKVWFRDSDTGKAVQLDTHIYASSDLFEGAHVKTPCIICDKNTTVLVEKGWTLNVLNDGSLELLLAANMTKQIDKKEEKKKEKEKEEEEEKGKQQEAADPVTLAVFANRFMGIAEQMGRVLQRIAISVNIKERLDFSCAIFGADGALVANAPHLPVHLGAMQEAVKNQIELLKEKWKEGEVILCNHPACGGSHLPDMTVITPVWAEVSPHKREPVFYVANRGHHADIGGITPGSMPPFSSSLCDEGAAIKSLKIVKNNTFQADMCYAVLGHKPKNVSDETYSSLRKKLKLKGNILPYIKSRQIENNISDLKAQVAANWKGIQLMDKFINEEGMRKVSLYMNYLQEASADSVKEMLYKLSVERNMNDVHTLEGKDYMDDGTPITLKLTIDRINRRATFDFSDVGCQVYGNINCPLCVTKSAIIYSLRCLVSDEVPLNQGCLHPVDIIVPQKSILNPTHDAAVVAGNVLTSQRLTDVILRTFGVCANSYGCMNNLTFGGEDFAFYETIGGGAGAGPTWDGASGVQCHMTNTRITDIETIERTYPVLIRAFTLRQNSGGGGLHKGGEGIRREYEVLCDKLTVSVLTERRCMHPKGLHGGKKGAMGLNLWVRRIPPFDVYSHSNLPPPPLSSPSTSPPSTDTSYDENEDEAAKIRYLQNISSFFSPAYYSEDDEGDNGHDEEPSRQHNETSNRNNCTHLILNLGGKNTVQMRRGDRLIILTPGGGGYGTPSNGVSCHTKAGKVLGAKYIRKLLHE